jgi:photosystem II stability/assembly factor-like uncharacterized protein
MLQRCFSTIMLIIVALFPVGHCTIAEVDCAQTDGNCYPWIPLLSLQVDDVVIIGGNNGAYWVSRDAGTTFVQRQSPVANASLDQVKLLEDGRIFGGFFGTEPVLGLSSDLGQSWSLPYTVAGGASPFSCLTFSPDGQLGAQADDSGAVPSFHYSADGVSWGSTNVAAGIEGACFYLGDAFFAAVRTGGLNYLFRRQTDGSFAAEDSKPGIPQVPDAVASDDTAVMIDAANNAVYYSIDSGVSWNGTPIGGGTGCQDLAYGNGLYVALCPGGDTFQVSSDVVTWSTNGVTPGSIMPTPTDIAFAHGYFYLVGNNGINAEAYRSTDLINWTNILSVSGVSALSVDGRAKGVFFTLSPD